MQDIIKQKHKLSGKFNWLSVSMVGSNRSGGDGDCNQRKSMPHPWRKVAIETTYKSSSSIVESSSIFLMKASYLNFYVNLDLFNLASNLCKNKHRYCGQNTMQLKEETAHGLLVPTPDTDNPTVPAFQELWFKLPVLPPGPLGHPAFPYLSLSISSPPRINYLAYSL